jgi:hypothetical protein
MIWALSSADRVPGLGLAWKRLWKACMAQAVTSWRRHIDFEGNSKAHGYTEPLDLSLHQVG